jgi:hypothetical protein
MTRRLEIPWPDPRPFLRRGGRPIRLLAASDEPDPGLDHAANRAALAPIDLVVGCGDLGPETLAFLGDAFLAPLLFVRGNHDRGGQWAVASRLATPSAGIDRRSLPGISVLSLPWPTPDREPAVHSERAAWSQVIRLLGSRWLRPGDAPWLVVSHVPPRGAGDTPGDPYHLGFEAYRAVLERLSPVLWLHGHTTRASARTWRVTHGRTTLVNVTGSVLVELRPPPEIGETRILEG